MSLSLGGYHSGYGHSPSAAGMGVTGHPDVFSSHYPVPVTGYQDYNVSDRTHFHNWILNSQPEPSSMSPDSYGSSGMCGTPSPNSGIHSQYGYMETDPIHPAFKQWTDYPVGGDFHYPHGSQVIPDSAQYESYFNSFGERCYRRRTSANRKERRRTLSINNAFSNLRGSIPNVPSDTKLSKIKTLRLAISYIAYLNEVLEKGDSKLAESGFKADISRKRERRPLPEELKKPLDSCVSVIILFLFFLFLDQKKN